MRQVGGDGVCGCSIGEPLRQQDTFKTFCSFERIGLPLVKSLRSIAQSLGSQLRL